MDGVLGLGVSAMQEEALAVSEEQIRALLEERHSARKAKNFARADEIRNKLSNMGIVLKDNPDGTTSWQAARKK
jgi:cysteinyl-tRNA synthetase